jgi:hypothetical protein
LLELGSGAAGERPAQLAGAVTCAVAGTVTGWNHLALQALRDAHTGPLAPARALAVLHTCMYNAWAAYDDDARQTVHGVAVRLPHAERSAASKASAMSHAAWLVLCGQFPVQQAACHAHMAGRGLDPMAAAGQLSPAGIGRTQAAGMLDFQQRDDDGDLALAAPPEAAPDAPARAGKPDPGRWYRLAHAASEHGRHDDDQDVLLFFALANALADAAVAGGDVERVSDAAAAEVLRRFSGRPLLRAGTAGADDKHDEERGRKVGALVFDQARRLWEGKL